MDKRRSTRGRVATLVVMLTAGAMIGSSATAGRVSQARPGRTADLTSLVRHARDNNLERVATAAHMRQRVAELAKTLANPADIASTDKLEAHVGLAPVRGSAVEVTLRDAPLDVRPVGVSADLLVVHQQDIQAVANALWAAGAEAMTIQDQRMAVTSGIKCVGNTVVIRGVPYAPPYVITAIGDTEALQMGLDDSSYLATYREQALAYKLGYSVRVLPETRLPGFTGRTELTYAQADA